MRRPALQALMIAVTAGFAAQLGYAYPAVKGLSSSRPYNSLVRYLRVSAHALVAAQVVNAQPPSASGEEKAPGPKIQGSSAALVEKGGALFQQNCSFCHGRDAGGGETGPDLTRSKLVHDDVAGDKISAVVHNGRTEKGMPGFSLSDPELAGLVAFIHSQAAKALAQAGKRRGVDVSDMQTGDAEAGRIYFNGSGGCASCHSPSGDLAGIASRYQGLQLEQRMLYPRDTKSKATITLPSGERIEGVVAYLDEFTIAVRDVSGIYRSWARAAVKQEIEDPAEAHVELFERYTDADIHNLMAYMQTLR